jgi:hypothetical protein
MAEYKNIVGTGFPPQIQAQIKKRESIVNSQTRDNNTLQFLTNRNAWVRLSSGSTILNKQLEGRLRPRLTLIILIHFLQN